MKTIAINYEADCSWIPEYTDDYVIYDRSDCGLPNRIPRENIGNVDYDRLSYLVDEYDTLPDVFLLTKSNLFKYISKEEFDHVKNNTTFTPLLTQHHKTYVPVCYYENNMYFEINNSWYLSQFQCKYHSWKEWADEFSLPNPEHIPFPPGGNFILTKETIHKYPKEFYQRMRDTLPYCQLPGEAQLAERSYYLLWQ